MPGPLFSQQKGEEMLKTCSTDLPKDETARNLHLQRMRNWGWRLVTVSGDVAYWEEDPNDPRYSGSEKGENNRV